MFLVLRMLFEAWVNLAFNFLVTHTWTTSVKVPGLASLPADAPLLVNGDYAVEVEIAVNAGAANVEVDVGSIDRTKIQSIIINADKAPMDVFTNAADGTGGQHIVLAANKSIAWNVNLLPQQTNPISANITKFFGNNASLVNGTLRIGVLLSS